MKIENLSYAELVQINERVTKAMPEARARELTAARKIVADIATEKGFALTELLGQSATPAAAKRQRKARTSTKMRDGAGVIWAGRGRQPKNFDKTTAVAA